MQIDLLQEGYGLNPIVYTPSSSQPKKLDSKSFSETEEETEYTQATLEPTHLQSSAVQ